MPQHVSAVGESVRKKLSRRILPFFFVAYIISYVDRANVSFAKVSMAADLGFSEAVYGFGAGIFFVGYFLLEIPGALIVEKWSARLWMSRILVTWGVCAALVGFARTPGQFYAARFCLGLAEGGFFPGVLVYLTHWFPASDRARALSGFILSVPVSFVIGAPFSALCLSVHWFSLAGWQWLFILQGLPAILLGIVTPFYLVDRPESVKWLSAQEREWLVSELMREREWKRTVKRSSILRTLWDADVWRLATALFCAVLASYGFIFWLPSTIQTSSGLSTSRSTLLSSLPFIAASLVVGVMGRSSDRRRERKLHAAVPLVAMGILFAGASISGQPFVVTMIWLTLAGSLLWAWTPAFWVLPTASLGESAAAASLGLINSVGALGGFVGPACIGYLLAGGHSHAFVIRLCSVVFALAAIPILLTRAPAENPRA